MLKMAVHRSHRMANFLKRFFLWRTDFRAFLKNGFCWQTVIKICLKDCMADQLQDVNGLFGRLILIIFRHFLVISPFIRANYWKSKNLRHFFFFFNFRANQSKINSFIYVIYVFFLSKWFFFPMRTFFGCGRLTLIVQRINLADSQKFP